MILSLEQHFDIDHMTVNSSTSVHKMSEDRYKQRIASAIFEFLLEGFVGDSDAISQLKSKMKILANIQSLQV